MHEVFVVLCLDLRCHIRQPEIDRLMIEDRLAEAFTLTGIGQRMIQRRARHTHRLRGNTDPTAFEIERPDPVLEARDPSAGRPLDDAAHERLDLPRGFRSARRNVSVDLMAHDVEPVQSVLFFQPDGPLTEGRGGFPDALGFVHGPENTRSGPAGRVMESRIIG